MCIQRASMIDAMIPCITRQYLVSICGNCDVRDGYLGARDLHLLYLASTDVEYLPNDHEITHSYLIELFLDN